MTDSGEGRAGQGDRVVAIGASAGGLEALTALLGGMDAEFALPILVVQHLAPHHVSHLVELLARRTALPVDQVRGGERLLPGHVYVAPPDHHLAVEDCRLQLNQEPLVHFSRPSVDVLFDSVARSFGRGAIGVVLSGSGRDVTTGACAIHDCGGSVAVQDRNTAVNFGMPGSVIAAGAADAVLSPSAIAAYLESESRGG